MLNPPLVANVLRRRPSYLTRKEPAPENDDLSPYSDLVQVRLDSLPQHPQSDLIYQNIGINQIYAIYLCDLCYNSFKTLKQHLKITSRLLVLCL